MTNSADPDQLAFSETEAYDLDLHCLQRPGIYGFSRTRVNFLWPKISLIMLDVFSCCDTRFGPMSLTFLSF